MTPAVRAVGIFAGTALLGGLVVGFLRPSPPSTPLPAPSPSSVPTSRAPRPDCPDRLVLEERASELEARTRQLELAIAAERVATAATEGLPIEWPVDLDARFREEGVETALRSAFDEVGGGELLGLDCSEFPCVFVAEFAPSTLEEPIEAGNALPDRLEERGYRVWGNASWEEDDEGVVTYWRTLAILPPEDTADLPDEEALVHRLQFRYRDVDEAVFANSESAGK